MALPLVHAARHNDVKPLLGRELMILTHDDDDIACRYIACRYIACTYVFQVKGNGARVLVMAPTRELVCQIFDVRASMHVCVCARARAHTHTHAWMHERRRFGRQALEWEPSQAHEHHFLSPEIHTYMQYTYMQYTYMQYHHHHASGSSAPCPIRASRRCV